MEPPIDGLPDRHFTVKSLAAYWGVSTSHIYNLIHSDVLRHMRIGDSIRIPKVFVKEFEEGACQTKTIFISSNNEKMESGISVGTMPTPAGRGSKQAGDAFQRGRATAAKQNNSGRNTSRD